MPQDDYSFAQTRIRLEEIVSQVRKKEVSLDKSLDLLEEGVRLANQCTELIDRADWDAAAGGAPAGAPEGAAGAHAESGGAGAADAEAAGDATAEDAADEVPDVPPSAAGDSQEGAEPQ